MKKNKLYYFFAFVIAITTIYIHNENNKVDYDELRKKHSEFLENSPYKETKSLQRDERKKLPVPLWFLITVPIFLIVLLFIVIERSGKKKILDQRNALILSLNEAEDPEGNRTIVQEFHW